MNAYDFMDVINHILISYHDHISIDYLLVDEVQDLPHKAIYLLNNLAKNQVFFAGDTA